MNAYDVLTDHHKLLHQLGERMLAAPPGTAERQRYIDGLLVELDIHMRIEDDLYYPALASASTLIAIAHAEHRQVYDQLAVALRTSPSSVDYQAEWESFINVLLAHAEEEERDLVPPPPSVRLTADELDVLGRQMADRMEALRGSNLETVRVRARAMLLKAF